MLKEFITWVYSEKKPALCYGASYERREYYLLAWFMGYFTSPSHTMLTFSSSLFPQLFIKSA